MKKVAILYSELAEYSLACFKALTDKNVSLLLIHWPINPEAPFKFDLSFCQSYSKDSLDKQELVNLVTKFSPDLILTSGWMDKEYVGICKKYFGKIPTVLTLDNHWTGSIKQRIACAISPFTLLRTFSNAFVPSMVQVNYALKLGFHADQIQTGFYCADTDKFSKYYISFKAKGNPCLKDFYTLVDMLNIKGFLIYGKPLKGSGWKIRIGNFGVLAPEINLISAWNPMELNILALFNLRILCQ